MDTAAAHRDRIPVRPSRLPLKPIVFAAIGLVLTCGCSGRQSALDPAGRGAQQIFELTGWMVVGLVTIWIIVIGLTFLSIRATPGSLSRRRAATLIIGGGVVVPTVLLTILLTFGLAMLPGQLAPPPEGSLKIHVIGEQWWWRVRYERPGETTVELANEIRLPVGEPVEFQLQSRDVIHAFWIPSLGGKVDMIPGRTTRLALHPTRTGRFRGACAEYCGGPHALMAFEVVVHEKEDFDRWLDQQAQPAETPDGSAEERGQQVFLASGCGACHTVRGAGSDGAVGPDLTHVGSRASLAGAILPNDEDAFARWVRQTDIVKPQVHMPHFGMLPTAEVEALAAYLEGLK